MKRSILIGFLSAVLTIALLPNCVMAAPIAASISLSPDVSTIVNGSSVAVTIAEDSGSEPVNAVQANITYPNNLLQYVSEKDGTAFSIIAQTAAGNGSVAIARGALPAVTGQQVIATVTFKAIAGSGSAALDFSAGSQIISATSNTNILSGKTGTVLSLSASTTSSGGSNGSGNAGSGTSSGSSSNNSSGSTSNGGAAATTANTQQPTLSQAADTSSPQPQPAAPQPTVNTAPQSTTSLVNTGPDLILLSGISTLVAGTAYAAMIFRRKFACT